VGAFCRFYELGKVPDIIDGDEGRFGLIIRDIINGNLKNMFGTVFGNSTLYFFFLAGITKQFGVTITFLRIGSAIAGTLVIPFIYLFAKHCFNRRVAWISTALLTVSSFHIHFSRIMSVTSIQDALFATMSLFWFYTGLELQSRNRMILAGLTLGFWLYIYMGARLIILLIPIFLLCMLWLQPGFLRKNIRNLGFFAGALGVIALPMIVWAIKHPELFNIRANQIGILQSGWLVEEALSTGLSYWHILLTLFKEAFLTTIFYPSYGFHFSKWPMLDPFTSVFFIAGLVYILFQTQCSKYLLINGWFWSGVLVGGALVIFPSSNTYRILIVFPAVCLIVGIGFDRLSVLLEEFFTYSIAHLIKPLGSIVFILIISTFHLRTYYYSAILCRYENPNTRLASLIASYMSEMQPDVQPYLLTAPQLIAGTHLSMEFLSPGRTYKQFKDPLIASPNSLDKNHSLAFFILPTRLDELKWIEQAFPGGRLDHIMDCKIKAVIIYRWDPPDIDE